MVGLLGNASMELANGASHSTCNVVEGVRGESDAV